MLNYKTLEYKPYIKNSNEDIFIDLLSKTYKLDKCEEIPLIVNQYYVGRPDLISLAVYGDDKYGDIICKYNGISNPFEINEDDVLKIPSINDISKLIDTTSGKSLLIKSDKDNIGNSAYIKKDNRKKINENRSSNEMVTGKSNYIIDKSIGMVFY